MIQPKVRPGIADDKRLNASYRRVVPLVRALEQKYIPAENESRFNTVISEVNAVPDDGRTLSRAINRAHSRIATIAEQELKLVAPGHYQTLWMSIGLASFGVPFGMLFGLLIDNFGLFGIGLPTGLAIGVAVGAGMERKAAEEGRQLDLEGEE